MLYWDEMRSKWGFNDGSSIPSDAEPRRDVYIKAVNVLAEKLNSNYRVAPYNRLGMHNWCLIVNVPKDIDITDVAAVARSEDHEDIQLNEAIQQCFELNLDQFFTVTVTIDQEGMNAFLEQLKTEEE